MKRAIQLFLPTIPFLFVVTLALYGVQTAPERTGLPFKDGFDSSDGDCFGLEAEFNVVTLCGAKVVFNYTDQTISFIGVEDTRLKDRVTVYRSSGGFMARNPLPKPDDAYQGENALFEPGEEVTIVVETSDADGWRLCARKSYLLGE